METVEVTAAGEGVVFPAVFVQSEVRLNPGQVVFSFFKELGEVSDEAFLFVDSFFKLSPLLLQQRISASLVISVTSRVNLSDVIVALNGG
ncbi:hypothetical protein ACTQ2W_08380 [Ligilactobacillus ruminis]|uniref:hypothetical protein n=1 Tax=Ligilactobacillus ruminis TaxID=1623 RepID=UPI003F9E49D4